MQGTVADPESLGNVGSSEKVAWSGRMAGWVHTLLLGYVSILYGLRAQWVLGLGEQWDKHSEVWWSSLDHQESGCSTRRDDIHTEHYPWYIDHKGNYQPNRADDTRIMWAKVWDIWKGFTNLEFARTTIHTSHGCTSAFSSTEWGRVGVGRVHIHIVFGR